jgi:hypothetical protein
MRGGFQNSALHSYHSVYPFTTFFQNQLETAPPHELKNTFQLLHEVLVSHTCLHLHAYYFCFIYLFVCLFVLVFRGKI